MLVRCLKTFDIGLLMSKVDPPLGRSFVESGFLFGSVKTRVGFSFMIIKWEGDFPANVFGLKPRDGGLSPADVSSNPAFEYGLAVIRSCTFKHGFAVIRVFVTPRAKKRGFAHILKENFEKIG